MVKPKDYILKITHTLCNYTTNRQNKTCEILLYLYISIYYVQGDPLNTPHFWP